MGVNKQREEDISLQLIEYFIEFWKTIKLDDKAKKTKRKYSYGLQDLGAYIVKLSIHEEDLNKTLDEILDEVLGPVDGPLVHHDNENWQEEFDAVCRKVYKYNLKRNA